MQPYFGGGFTQRFLESQDSCPFFLFIHGQVKLHGHLKSTYGFLAHLVLYSYSVYGELYGEITLTFTLFFVIESVFKNVERILLYSLTV